MAFTRGRHPPTPNRWRLEEGLKESDAQPDAALVGRVRVGTGAGAEIWIALFFAMNVSLTGLFDASDSS